jgi:hypothetical protein
MATRTFKLSVFMEDIGITLRIDTSVMTEALATEVNNFWSGSAEVLAAADGDVIQAVARRTAPFLIRVLLDGMNEDYAVRELGEQEGWPVDCGIELVDFVIPNFSATELDVEEV